MLSKPNGGILAPIVNGAANTLRAEADKNGAHSVLTLRRATEEYPGMR